MTMTHLVVGAGPVGTAVARELAARGDRVTLASRSGQGATVPGVTRVAVDAADATAVRSLAAGVDVLVNAVNPPRYDRWPTMWPPVAAALLAGAESSGAVLATVSNLYPYGRVDAPMTEETPLRPADSKGRVRMRMWQDALAAHEAGRVRVVEVRGSDYVGLGAQGHATRAATAVLAGTRARLVGRPDVPHSWTYTGDVARLLVAAALDADAHGRAWHVPSNPPRTPRELVADLAEAAGLPPVPVSGIPVAALRLAGLVDPLMRGAAGAAYQFTAPFIIDDTAARDRFGLAPTPWGEALRETVAGVPGRAGARAPAAR